MRRPVGLRRFFTPSNRKGIKMSDEKKLTTAEEIDLNNIIANLDPSETAVDYIKGLAVQLRGSEGIMMGPTDSDLCAAALDRLAASI
jgi:hypothetical protein